MSTSSAVLRGILREHRDKKVLSPIIRAALHDPNFKGFPLQVEGWTARPYDGWFHPSTHATKTVDELIDYLTHPENHQPEEHPPLVFVLAVTQGKFWHTFIQRLLLDHGILLQDEVPLIDPTRRRRGHTDGLLANGELLEIKTSSSRSFRKFTNCADLIANEPGYYAQTQDYLDMAEAEYMRYLVMCMESPYEFSEFLVPADGLFQTAQRRKYREAVETAAQGQIYHIPIPTPEQSSALLYGTPLH
jgi:hypothetical protein